MSPTAPRLNLRTLDMLRGILAVYVLLGHCRWLLWSGHGAWMAAPHAKWLEPLVYASASVRFGREAVMIFFALSGFFIHLRFARSPETTRSESATSFYWRRAHRLAAPYVFALVVTVLLDSIGRMAWPALYAAATGDPLTDSIFALTGYSWRSVAPALVVLPSSLGIDFGTNGPLWSLAYEVVYYAMYPAWLLIRRSSAVAAYGAVPVACLMLVFVPLPAFVGSVLIRYPVWLAGAAVAELLSAGQVRVSVPVTVTIFAAAFNVHVSGVLAAVPALAPIVYGGAAVAACAGLSSQSIRWWPVRLFEYLGVRSYSIYIVHFPMVALLSAAVFAHGGRPLHGWFAIGGAVIAVVFGCLCFELCERHFVHHRVPEATLAA